MKRAVPYVMERGRVVRGAMASTAAMGMNGAFMVPFKGRVTLRLLVSDGSDWFDSGLALPVFEHVSVCAIRNGVDTVPTWEMMCFVKQLCWEHDEVVVQYHPARDNYVNNHEFVLHLWRPLGVQLPMPPIECV